jgi:prepilin-type N-terminal cleavage/methylation domain-containing protein
MRQPDSGCRGFTLVEMVIAIVVLGIVAVVGAQVIVNGMQAASLAADNNETLSKINYATERMVREIRETQRNPLLTSDYEIATRTASIFAFTKSDGVTVTLTSGAPLLTIGYNSPAGTFTLTDQVTSASFTYYQLDGVTISDTNANIAFVEISLTLTSATGFTSSQRVRVALRNTA